MFQNQEMCFVAELRS